MKIPHAIVLATGLFLGALVGLGILEPREAQQALGEVEAIIQAPPESPGYGTDTPIVVRVIDGDTIVLSNGEHVRYIGIDTPEIGRNGKRPECFAEEAMERNAELVLNKRVTLIADKEERDRYGRLLRYLLVDGKNVNLALVQEGYAKRIYIAPNGALQKDLREAEHAARNAGLGRWSSCE